MVLAKFAKKIQSYSILKHRYSLPWSRETHTTNFYQWKMEQDSNEEKREHITLMQALQLMKMAKRHVLRRSDIKQQSNQICSLSH